MRILGLDLAPQASAAVLLPEDWGLDWGRVRTLTVGVPLPHKAPEPDKLRRIAEQRDAIVRFAREQGADMACVEQYAFSADRSRAHLLGELGGVVKLALHELGLPVMAVPPASARALLGRVPRADGKVWAVQRLLAAGAPREWSLDTFDAMAVANFGLSSCASTALIMRTAADDVKPKRKRAA